MSVTCYHARTYVVGVDISRPMLRLADRRARRLGLSHVSLWQMAACRLAFPAAAFDIVLSAFVASVVPDRPTFFSELKRVCKPEGVICIINHVRFRAQPLAWLEEHLQPVTRRLGWHTDLALEEITSYLGPGRISVHALWPLEPWPIVICRR